MKYGIESKTDISSGMTLTICFPERELDLKALYTLQADWPEFLVPFRHRCVDGQVECIYQLGSRSKLQYRFCSREPGEYVKFWNSILRPLLDCSDWFLKPMSFVLDAGQIYVDRDGKTISYLYVPAKEDCTSYEELKKMTVELAEKNPTTDPKLENKVLRAVMQDFQPKEFLNMLRESAAPAERKAAQIPPAVDSLYPEQPLPPSAQHQPPPLFEEKPVHDSGQPSAPPPVHGDIIIDLNGGKANKEKSSTGGKNKKPKKAKEKKEAKGLFGLFGGKKAPDKKEEKAHIMGAGAESAAPREEMRAMDHAPVYIPEDADEEHTELKEYGPCLKLIGRAPLPPSISVSAAPGKPFTIGRFDISVGQQQCDFEFERHTKEISRHHAAIELGPDGRYAIIDLGSTAGTYVDGIRIRQNEPHPLQWGSRVSFGTAGADYTWEE